MSSEGGFVNVFPVADDGNFDNFGTLIDMVYDPVISSANAPQPVKSAAQRFP